MRLSEQVLLGALDEELRICDCPSVVCRHVVRDEVKDKPEAALS
jgi:hypothetical protein